MAPNYFARLAAITVAGLVGFIGGAVRTGVTLPTVSGVFTVSWVHARHAARQLERRKSFPLLRRPGACAACGMEFVIPGCTPEPPLLPLMWIDPSDGIRSALIVGRLARYRGTRWSSCSDRLPRQPPAARARSSSTDLSNTSCRPPFADYLQSVSHVR